MKVWAGNIGITRDYVGGRNPQIAERPSNARGSSILTGFLHTLPNLFHEEKELA
jgi:hypothetical protein